MKCRLQNILTVRVAVLMSAVAVALGGCRPFVEVEMLPSGVVEHTLVMYLNANNNLAHHIKANALDAERGMMGALPSTRLVIYLDEAESTTLYEVRYLQYGSANYVKHTTVLKEYPEQTSTSPEVMKSVLEDIKALVPSKSYGLVMGCHGSGWFPEPDSGLSYDNQKSLPAKGEGSAQGGDSFYDEYPFAFLTMQNTLTRSMGYDGPYLTKNPEHYFSTAELVEGFSPIKFEYIIFDACFMASVEFLYELRNSADYVIASPVEVWGPGFPYEYIVPLLMGPKHNLVEVCEKIMEIYRTDRNFSDKASAAVALVDCSKLAALTESVAAVWSKVSGGESMSYSEVVELIAAEVDEKKIQVLDRMRPAGFYDLVDYVEQLALVNNKEVDLTSFKRAFADAVLFADNTEEVTSYGYSGSAGSLVQGFGVIEPKEGSDTFRICGLNCYLLRTTAPVTQSYYFQTKWAQMVYGL